MKIKFIRKKNREDGSGPLTVLALLAALGMATSFVLQQSNKISMNIQQAKSIENTRAVNIANMNSLARIRALINPQKMPDNSYKPSLVGINYWHLNWKLTSNPAAPAVEAVVQGAGDKVKMKSVQLDDKDVNAVKNVLEGSAPLLGLAFDDTIVDILRTTFDVNQKLALSLDVKVTSQQQIKGQNKHIESFARIPLTAPVPYNPRLEVSPSGTNAWSTNFTGLVPGLYDLRVLASGIAFDAIITINGMPDITVGGFNLSGAVISQANNYLAINAEVGRATVDLGTGGGGGSVVGCVFVPGINSASAYTISVKINGPAGGTVPTANTATYAMTTVGSGSAPPLSDADANLACNSQCPSLDIGGDPNASAAILARVTAGNYGDLANDHLTTVERNHFNVGDKKLCTSVARAVSEYLVRRHTTVLNPLLFFYSGLSGYFEYYTYQPSTCARTFLFTRATCGCFSDDTKILLGDGTSEKRITELTAEDLIWNPITKKAMEIAKMTKGPEPIPMLEVSVAGKSVKVTGKHPFPTPEGVRTAFTLQVGDQIKIGSSSEWVKIDKIQVLAVPEGEPPVVWNLELKESKDEADHYLVADGIITGDLYLQRLLETNAASTR